LELEIEKVLQSQTSSWWLFVFGCALLGFCSCFSPLW